MKNILQKTVSKIILIGKIKGLAAESKHTSNLKNGTSFVPKKYKYSNNKRIIGLDIRHHLLAYAFLSGKQYSVLEKKCRVGNEPRAADIVNIAMLHVPEYVIRYGKLTVEIVNDWIAGK